MRSSFLLALVAAITFWFMREPIARFFRVDRCLDRGGAWDYDANGCRDPGVSHAEASPR